MARDRGEVVVRVRRIAEDRAAIAAASSIAAANAAAHAAELARERTRQHPLGGRTGAMSAAEFHTVAGSGAALRETAAVAERDEQVARTEATAATALVVEARANREAAERFIERRRATVALVEGRRDQRRSDESAVAGWRAS